jgi:hypothetical protein
MTRDHLPEIDAKIRALKTLRVSRLSIKKHEARRRGAADIREGRYFSRCPIIYSE